MRQEIEQHYKRKDSHATRGGSHVTRGDSHVLLEDSHVARVHIQTRLPGDRVSERNAVTLKSDDVQKKGKTEVAAPRKQVHFYSLFRNLKGLSCQLSVVKFSWRIPINSEAISDANSPTGNVRKMQRMTFEYIIRESKNRVKSLLFLSVENLPTFLVNQFFVSGVFRRSGYPFRSEESYHRVD